MEERGEGQLTEHLLIGLASIIVLGVSAQWIAWWLRVPAILLLLLFGLIAGPIAGFLDPDALMGDLLLPIVSISVAIVLFEGGLTLNMHELPKIGRVLRNLVSLGAGITWVISTVAAHLFLGLDWALSTLLGAILIVSGPTVIGPLLRHVRPIGQVGPILRWEGIVIDPIGAMLAVLVFEAILIGELRHATTEFGIGAILTIVIGSVLGLCGAWLLTFFFKRYWIPDFLQNPVTLMALISIFSASNALQEEAGLYAVTIMGIALANQKSVSVRHIIEFKENLRVVLISSLFILLAAHVQLDAISKIGWGGIGFLIVLIVIARPAAVAVSTLGSDLEWRERAFLAWIAPRGIVAAAVSSIFALRLTEAGYPQAERFVAATFLVIIGTVAVYSLTASALARKLQLASPNPQGVLITGAHRWAREMASALKDAGHQVLLVDTNWENISAARMAGLPTHYGSILAEDAHDHLELGGIGRLLAVTPNDGINTLAALHFSELFSRAEVYQLPAQSKSPAQQGDPPHHLRGRLLFSPDASYAHLSEQFEAGAEIRKTRLTEEFDYDAFQAHYGGTAIPLFVINGRHSLGVYTTEQVASPRAGQTLISLVHPEEEQRQAEQGEPELEGVADSYF